MNTKNLTTLTAVAALLFSMFTVMCIAAEPVPLTPEYAAKKENFRKQKEQQITPDKKKAAAEGLKAERLRIYQAKQAKHGKHGTHTGQEDTHAKPEKSDDK